MCLIRFFIDGQLPAEPGMDSELTEEIIRLTCPRSAVGSLGNVGKGGLMPPG